MRVIELDASGWNDVLQFLGTLRAALGSPDGHGWSPDAFVDSMIWGGINQVEPPYQIRIIKMHKAPLEVRDYIALVASTIEEARKWKFENRGADTEVSIQVLP